MARTHRRRSVWGRFLFIWALILLLLGAAACCVLYKYLEVYEVTRPEPVMDSLVQSGDAESLIQEALANNRLELTEFEDPEELYRSYLDTVDTTRTLSYRQDSRRSTEDRLVYAVRSGPSVICNVVLTADGDSPGFNRRYWRISEICTAPITEQLPSVTVNVDAVSGTELFLNGKALDSRYESEESVPIPYLTRFESEMDPPPSLVRYTVGPLYGEVTLTNSRGVTLSPDEESDPGTVHYTSAGNTQGLSIRAPEDIKIYINGVQIGKEEVVSSSDGVLEGLELYTRGETPKTRVYQIDGLYAEPVITAVDLDGSSVTPVSSAENSFTFFHNGEAETEELIRPIAENYFNAYMDYSSHAFDYTRYYNLLGKIHPNCNLYQYVSNSQEAMYWASGTETEYKDLRYDNFHMVNDYVITCTVIYSADMTATNWYEEYSYNLENAYELAFISESGKWLAAGMNVITES